MTAPVIAKALRAAALRLPDVEERVACEGTALEKRTIKAKKKAFLFLGAADAMLKLADSLAEAKRLAAKSPEHYKVGATGWVTVKFADADPPRGLVERWIEESYALVAGKSAATRRAPSSAPPRRPRA